jgi:nucleoside-diphosphate-sugar epimerase
MILVTGGTGFIGNVLVKNLIQSGEEVRILLYPSAKSPNLPRGVALDVAVCSLTDERGLQAAMRGVKVVFHLASAERSANPSGLMAVDVLGTQAIVDAAHKAQVERLLFISHITADKNSHFPALKAKALAENILEKSKLNYTIIRSTTVFGPGDHFTIQILKMLHQSFLFFILPGNGEVTLQPLWIQDLITCMTLSIKDQRTFRKLVTIGGGEYLNYKSILKIIMNRSKIWRLLIPFSPAYLRTLNLWLNRQGQGIPYPTFLLDYLAADRTCALDTLPKFYGLLPARFEKELNYLHTKKSL